jgi:hypothetical protein
MRCSAGLSPNRLFLAVRSGARLAPVIRRLFKAQVDQAAHIRDAAVCEQVLADALREGGSFKSASKPSRLPPIGTALPRNAPVDIPDTLSAPIQELLDETDAGARISVHFETASHCAEDHPWAIANSCCPGLHFTAGPASRISGSTAILTAGHSQAATSTNPAPIRVRAGVSASGVILQGYQRVVIAGLNQRRH